MGAKNITRIKKGHKPQSSFGNPWSVYTINKSKQSNSEQTDIYIWI